MYISLCHTLIFGLYLFLFNSSMYMYFTRSLKLQNKYFDFAVILGNAYMSLFFAVGQASQALDQSMKAYAQAVSD